MRRLVAAKQAAAVASPYLDAGLINTPTVTGHPPSESAVRAALYGCGQ